jgi:hypothetical protein
MHRGFDMGNALVFQPGIQLGQAFYTRLGQEQRVTHVTNLVLNLTLLPTRRRGPGTGLRQMVRAHL